MSTEHCIIHCTCPSSEIARRIATMLIQQQEAACVNLIPGVTSIYNWKGELHADNETLMVIKSLNRCFEAVSATIRQHHPAELPEIIAVSIDSGSDEYLDWIEKCVK